VDEVKHALVDASTTIQLAMDYLHQAIDATRGRDPEIVRQIRIDSASLDAFLVQVVQTTRINDDQRFRAVVDELKSQAAMLRAISDRIRWVANDGATPPAVGGFMEQAVAFIAQAIALVKGTP
jgi:hypothetical protein